VAVGPVHHRRDADAMHVNTLIIGFVFSHIEA
jgi:hypothetical protein